MRPTQHLVLLSGNLMKTGTSRVHLSQQSTTDEILLAVNDSLRRVAENEPPVRTETFPASDSVLSGTDYILVDSKHLQALSEEERKNVEVSVKAFALADGAHIPSGALTQAVKLLLEKLNFAEIQNLALATPGTPFSDNQEDAAATAQFTSLWEEVDQLQKIHLVVNSGVTDFAPENLKRLIARAKNHPAFDQVAINVESPHYNELAGVAEQLNVSLLSHNDPKDVLTEKDLGDLLSKWRVAVSEGCRARPLVVLRYSSVIRCRSIVTNKGYLILCSLV